MLSPKADLRLPCPCGSGRKYKNCCWVKERREYAAGREAISNAIFDIFDYVHEYMMDDMAHVTNVVLKDLYYQFGSETMDSVKEAAGELFGRYVLDACACDLESNGGANPIDLYLQEKGDSLHPWAVEFLGNWKETSLSLFEIQKVNHRKSFTAKDVFSRKEYLVTDGQASENIESLDFYFLRIVPVRDEYLLVPLFLPVDQESIDLFKDNIKGLKKKIPGSKTVTWKRFFKKNWFLIPHLWLENIALSMEPPIMLNTDGDPIEMLRLEFHLKRGSSFQVNSILFSIPGMERVSDASYNFVVDTSQRKDTTLDNVIISSLDVSETEVIARVNSGSRADMIVDLLKKHLGKLIEDITEEEIYYDPEQGYGDSEDEIPSDIKIELMTEFLDNHYKKWLDMPLPALDGLTPRQAAKKPAVRRKLITLLQKDTASPVEGFSYDKSWLWKELGLKIQ